MLDPDALKTFLDAHHPSIRTADDDHISRMRFDLDADNADLAQRTCACGAEINGFDDFLDHLNVQARYTQ